MRQTYLLLLAALVLLVAVPALACAGNDGVVPDHDRPSMYRPRAGINEKIGEYVPLDLVLRDENDAEITLGAAMSGRPTILVPVYYRCPMLCTKILDGVLEAVRKMDSNYSAGTEFSIIVVSMDPKEHGSLAREKKKHYVAQYGRPRADIGWRFLTGDVNEKVASARIATLLGAVGYTFEFDKMLKEYNHPSAIIILSPQGKVCRYFYGLKYHGEFELDVEGTPGPDGKITRPTRTLQLSLIDANDGKGGSLLDKFILLCYRYDALHQGYRLNILRAVQIGGVITLFALGVSIWLMVRKERQAAIVGVLAPGGNNPETANRVGGSA